MLACRAWHSSSENLWGRSSGGGSSLPTGSDEDPVPDLPRRLTKEDVDDAATEGHVYPQAPSTAGPSWSAGGATAA